MKTEVDGNKYTIAGVSRTVTEAPIFKPENGQLGYGIFDSEIAGRKDESGARWVIEPGKSSRAMRFKNSKYHALRAVSEGEGYFLVLLSDKQLVCQKVKKGDNVSFGLGNKTADCLIASKDGPGMEVVEFGTPIFDPSMEKEIKRSSKNVPREFLAIKKLLKQGKETEAFDLLGQYQSRQKQFRSTLNL